jgi:hypothetical protein
VTLVHPGTGETLGWWAARMERGHRRNGARIVEHAQRLCDERLVHGALLSQQGKRTILAVGPTRVWALLGDTKHPDRAEEVVAEWPRARVSLREADGKERVLGFIPVRLVELGLPDGNRTRMRPHTLSLETAYTLGNPPTEAAYVVDDDGLERVEPDGRSHRVAWETLRHVTLVRPTAQGWEAVRFAGDDGELVVPFDAVREVIWDRVRQLPGTNTALVDAAILSTGVTDRQVWWHGMDTDSDVIP